MDLKMQGETYASADKDTTNYAEKRVYILKPGYVYNPLKKYPRNGPCICGSGKKFKKCHLDLLPDAITVAEANKMAIDFHNLKGNRHA